MLDVIDREQHANYALPEVTRNLLVMRYAVCVQLVHFKLWPDKQVVRNAVLGLISPRWERQAVASA